MPEHDCVSVVVDTAAHCPVPQLYALVVTVLDCVPPTPHALEPLHALHGPYVVAHAWGPGGTRVHSLESSRYVELLHDPLPHDFTNVFVVCVPVASQ